MRNRHVPRNAPSPSSAEASARTLASMMSGARENAWHAWLRRILAPCLLFLLLAPAWAEMPVLSPAERAWLLDHPVIEVATFSDGFPPFEMTVNGKVDGVGPSYLTELTRQLGIQVNYKVFPTWRAVVDAARAGKVDLVMNLSPTPERAEYLVFSHPYFEHLPVLVTRMDNSTLTDASGIRPGTRLAAMEGDATAEVAQRHFPGVRMVHADSMIDAMRLIADGRADACIEDPFVVRAGIFAAGLQRELRVGPPVALPIATLGFAAPKDRAPLIGALNRVLDGLTAEDHARLRMPWLDVENSQAQSDEVSIPLSEAERDWLSKVPPLRVAFDSTSPPYTLLDRNGQPAGIANDYLREVARTLHLRLTYVPANSWAQGKALMREGKVDILPVASPYSEDAPLMTFSMTYLDYPVMVITRMDDARINNVMDLRGKRITANTSKFAVHAVTDRLRDTTVIAVPTTEAGLAQVADGKADAFIGDLANADYIIREHFAGRLKISAPTDDYVVLAMGVSREYARLVPLINRVLMNIPERRHQVIRNTWLASRYTYGGSWKEIARKTLPLMAIVAAFLIIISYAYLRLRRETRQRQRSEEQLTDITRSLPVVVFKFQYSRTGGIRFLFVSGNPEPIFGEPAETFLEDEPRAFNTVFEEDRAPLLEEIERAARTLTPLQADIRVVRDGNVRWISTNAIPHRADNNLIFNGYWVDITEQRLQADQLARAKEQAEAATHAKTEFLVTMSHEIRTPMSGVIGMLELLGHTALSEEQRQMLGTVETSATALLQILDDVLDFSKIEAGRLTIEYVPVDVRDLVDSTVSILSAPAHRKGLALRIRVDKQLAAEVSAENVRLRQVLLNLLSNAIKFTMLGSVGLDVSVLEDDGEHQRVRFSVIDTGIGMSPDQIERLFAPFTQAESSTTRRYGGTGLGLYICRRLVQLMGGEITLESEPDQGTQVHVDLWMPVYHRRYSPDLLHGRTAAIATTDPQVTGALEENLLALGFRVHDDVNVADLLFVDDDRLAPIHSGAARISVTRSPDPHGYASTLAGITITSNPIKWSTFAIACRLAMGLGIAAPDALPGPLPARAPGRRILVAEDSLINQTLIAAQLDKLGYTCDIVGNGVEALHAYETSDYGLLITDCHMPLMDGYELARSIRRHEMGSGKHLHIIAMTANAVAGELERCQAAGMDDFVSKPVRMSELRQRLEQALAPLEEEPVSHASSPIDVDISMLRECFGEDEVIHSLITRFVATTRTDLMTLDLLIAQRRCDDVAHWVHRLLGGLQVFGANSLSDIGAALELAMRSPARYEHLSDAVDFRQRVALYMDRLEDLDRELNGA